MERYKMIKEVGNGTFGTVWRALNKQTGQVVAIKKMKKKYYSLEECINLREVKSLRKMNHANIVKLKEVIREHDILYFVFEYMECNLYQLMKDRGKLFSESEVRNWCFQVFQGLAYMHQRGYFHRDLKPDQFPTTIYRVCFNTLVGAFFILKLHVFLCIFIVQVSSAWRNALLTAKRGPASSAWRYALLTAKRGPARYRAPEVLLQSPIYSSAVDMWAMGAIMAELLSLRPLFPGSSEADEIYKICSVIGSPTESVWAEGLELASAISYQFPQLAGVHLSALIPSASNDAINLITLLCSWDPCKRPTGLEALQHPFFQSCFYVPPSLRSRSAVARTPPSAGTRGDLEQRCARKYSGPSSNPKPQSNFSSTKPNELLSIGVQRKLEMNYQDAIKNDKSMKSSVKQQPRYRPHARNSPSANRMEKARSVSDTAEKLASMTVGSRRPPVRQSLPPQLKAGGWHDQSDWILRRSQETLPGRNCTRKVVG
ncbi:unnamed protein product [Ilex paraguariensis]|uniref:non-specific serine/threonine protein kinase n=1 Tax=Ilex paraguariensis TaxID=185542 RepID=A0ABC8S7X0_9AQUA